MTVFVIVGAALIFRSLLRGKGPGYGKVTAALVLLALSRFIFVNPDLSGMRILLSAAYSAGVAGFYFLVVSILESGSRERKDLWNPDIVISASIVVAPGVAVCVWLTGGSMTSIGSLALVGVFAHGGMAIGMLRDMKREKSEFATLPFISVVLFSVAGILQGLVLSGCLSDQTIFAQLLSLCDLGALALLVVWPVSEPGMNNIRTAIPASGVWESGKLTGESEMEKIAEIARKSASAGPLSDKYRDVCASLMEAAEADFVILNVLMDGEENYYATASAGSCDEFLTPEFSRGRPRERFEEFLSEESLSGRGHTISRTDLGGDSEIFVPQQMGWRKDHIFVYPIKEGAEVPAFLTVGFCDAECGLGGRLMESYASILLHLVKRERADDDIRDLKIELERSRRDLERANQLKSNFISVISHELRTPLTSVKAYVETLMDNVTSIKRDMMEDFLKVMKEENERVIKLVDNILDYSTMETGQLRYQKESCDIATIVKGVYNELENDMLKSRIDCDIHLPRNPVVMDVDRDLIHQLFFNLMNNAIKFTPERGRIMISLEEEASGVRVIVQDTGKGIPEDQLERVFERFHQVDGSDTREHGGSGLGLAICKDIVEWHDGRIWVENIKEAGARFTVVLPVRDVVVRTSGRRGTVGITKFNRERFLVLLVDMLAGFLQARKASIMTLDEKEKVLRVLAAKGVDAEFVQNTKVAAGERIAGRVFEEGRPVHIHDIENDEDFRRINNSSYYGTHSFISVPLKEDSRIIGVLNVSDRVDGKEFSESDREVLESLTGIIIAMLKKLDAYEIVSDNFNRLKEAMEKIIEFREGVGSRDLSLYTRIAVEMGRKLGMEEETLAAIRIGMNIYDVGMMKVPRHIRGKMERLQEGEWEQIKKHTDVGYTMISPMGLDDKILKMVRGHHESFDGGGYPDGLEASEANVGSGIIHVVDSFRALISQSPYKKSVTAEEAVAEITNKAGVKFDPVIVRAFLRVVEEFGEEGILEQLEEASGTEIAIKKKVEVEEESMIAEEKV